MELVTTPLTNRAPIAQRRGIASVAGLPARLEGLESERPDVSSPRSRTPNMHTAERYERPLILPPALRPWFTRAGRIPSLDAAGLPFTHIPDARIRLTLRHEASGRRDAVIVGPHTRASYNAADEPASCLRLNLAPGAVRPLLGIAAAELTDHIVELGELPGPLAEFADRLLHSSFTEAMTLLEDGLPQHIPDHPSDTARRALLDAAISAMTTAPAPVPEIAARLAVSERQLRNLFTAGIGVSPKHFVRIDRIRRLVSEAGRHPLAQVAATTGYYDQSHMTADFRALMGIAPTRFFGGNLPAPTPCRSLLAVRKAA